MVFEATTAGIRPAFAATAMDCAVASGPRSKSWVTKRCCVATMRLGSCNSPPVSRMQRRTLCPCCNHRVRDTARGLGPCVQPFVEAIKTLLPCETAARRVVIELERSVVSCGRQADKIRVQVIRVQNRKRFLLNWSGGKRTGKTNRCTGSRGDDEFTAGKRHHRN